MESSLPADADRILRREGERVIADLVRDNPRALSENPEGTALIADALREAMVLGLAAGCAEVGIALSQLEFPDDAWPRWRRQRELSVEAAGWPPELALNAPKTVDRARNLLAAAGRELGFHGRAIRRLEAAGAQAAEAGAALPRALTEPPDPPERPASAVPAALGDIQPDRTLRVALAANQAEADLLRGVLANAGIPSTWRRTGGDLPELLGAGYREIYVPAAAAEEAQAVLSTLEKSETDEEPAPTRRVGLERTGVRVLGKATAAYLGLGILFSVAIGIATANLALGGVAVAATVALGASLVVWSERARR